MGPTMGAIQLLEGEFELGASSVLHESAVSLSISWKGFAHACSGVEYYKVVLEDTETGSRLFEDKVDPIVNVTLSSLDVNGIPAWQVIVPQSQVKALPNTAR